MGENLWPNFRDPEPGSTPKAMIEEAGMGVDEKTGHLVQFINNGMTVNNETVTMHCSLYAPRLDYAYPFLTASWKLDGYPVTLQVYKQPAVTVHAPENLTKALREAFNEVSTVAVVQQLMNLSGSSPVSVKADLI